ncbi:unnamed protein product [Blumeria hordei]|uniref:Uncharacterized protein n=1 Tax=Blumeria hordei TaxID=2867405 RepID=A0A383UKA1_BLUHO|nr:unnamed protein product [Blumeria hordei]
MQITTIKESFTQQFGGYFESKAQFCTRDGHS